MTADTIDSDIVRLVQNARKDLLDLSSRNRLISTPRESSRGKKIEIVDERSEEVFRLLVRERKAMSFLPGKGDEPEDAESPDGEVESESESEAPQLAQPEDEPTGDSEPQAHHLDLRLQTRMTSQRLQDRLLDLYYDAEISEQEQGVSILYLAVVDPDRPGRYLLGIECDGTTYHSSRSARDRDRLREAVLRDRGSRIHRIWSTDWFHRPEEQLRKVVEAIEKARTDAEIDEEAELIEEAAAEAEAAESALEREEPTATPDGGEATWSQPYVEADFAVPGSTPIHETPLVELVQIEGPIHREEIAWRVTALWGLQRTGARIVDTIGRAIDTALQRGRLKDDEGFVAETQQEAVPVRDRSQVASANLKKPEMLPPAEIRQAILHLVSDHLGLRREEVAVLVARALGFKATSARLKEAIETILDQMIAENAVVARREAVLAGRLRCQGWLMRGRDRKPIRTNARRGALVR